MHSSSARIGLAHPATQRCNTDSGHEQPLPIRGECSSNGGSSNGGRIRWYRADGTEGRRRGRTIRSGDDEGCKRLASCWLIRSEAGKIVRKKVQVHLVSDGTLDRSICQPQLAPNLW